MTEVHSVNIEDEALILADEFYDALMRYSRESPRSQQAGRFQIGVSDLGFCNERTRRMLDGQVPDDVDVLPAFHGTAIGDHAEKAWKATHPTAIIQAAVTIRFLLDIDGKTYEVQVPGHPDIVQPEGLLLDIKTDMGLADVQRNGASPQQRFQRHDYALAAFQKGLFNDDVTLDDILVGNVWIDRSAVDRFVHVELEPFNLEVVSESERWLEDVVYHLVNKEPAQKVPPRDMCEKVCGYFRDCRLFDTDVSGLIDDPIAAERVRMYDEGRAMVKEGKRLQDSAKHHLHEMGNGMVRVDEDIFSVRSTWVNPTLVPESQRRGYDKLEVKKVKR